MTTSDSLFSFRSGECGVGSYEINIADWVMVSCLNGSNTFVWFQLKTKELTIDGEFRELKKDLTGFGIRPKADYFSRVFGLRLRPNKKMQLRSVIDGKIKVRKF